MGYTTDFSGQFTVTPALLPDHREYLLQFAQTRRMKRNPEIAATLPDPIRDSVDLPIGYEGAYFVGQDTVDDSVIDGNTAPGCPSWSADIDWELRWKQTKDAIASGMAQPGLWCQWVPTEDGDGIEWDGGEKFYEYEAWIKYLVRHFLAPWGYKINGEVSWQGEDAADIGTIYAKDNVIEAVESHVTNPGPSWSHITA